jgi:glycosyltransferase involved in cell wall biosynthesis
VTPTVGIVVPAFRPDVERLRAYVADLHEHLAPAVVRVELDDPADATLEALSDLPATVNAVDRRRGKGAAVTAGFEALETDVLAFADADGATPASSLADVVAPVVADEADLTAGSRRHPEATVRSHQTVARRFLGDGFAWIARRLLDVPLHDFQCGAKGLSREAWEAVRPHLHEPGFAWDIELLAVAGALDLRVREVPVVWEDQPGSTVSTAGTVLRLGAGLVRSRALARTISGDRLYRRLAPSTRPLVDRLAAEAKSTSGAGPADRSPGTTREGGDS